MNLTSYDLTLVRLFYWQRVADQIKTLERDGRLLGVLDDRGTYMSVTKVGGGGGGGLIGNML